MYGTIARYRIQPGMEGQFRHILEEQVHVFEAGQIPGFVAGYVYRMDADPHDYYLAVVFESREAYQALAQSPEQDARYRQLLAVLENAPEWHDGDILTAELPQATT